MTAPNTPTPSTPSGRIKRSVIQGVTGLVTSIPVIVNNSHISALHAGKYAVEVGVLVIAVSVGQNVLERLGILKPR